MTKKIIVIGNGGREHAICYALNNSPQKPEIWNFATAVNPGIKELGVNIEVVPNIEDFDALKSFIEKVDATLIIPGPEAPLANGIADFCNSIGINCFGPTQANAQLESSKSWTRNLLRKHNINDACPDFIVSTEMNDDSRAEFFKKMDGQVVVKADGLLGGKGVIVAGDHFTSFEDADEFAKKSVEKFGRVVIEEKLIGVEFSVISIVDGMTVLDSRICQDHKRVGLGDSGPQTGGMGVISNENGTLPFLTDNDLKLAHDITERVMHACKKENGEDFVGVMYGGFIATKTGIQLIEYNVRFGDPEALNILGTLTSDLVDVCEKACEGKLHEIDKLNFEPIATVQKYLCAPGYPDAPEKGVKIELPSSWDENKVRVFHAGTKEENGQLLSSGGRVLGIVGLGANMDEANANCEAFIANTKSELFHRSDIGTEKLTASRSETMKGLRT